MPRGMQVPASMNHRLARACAVVAAVLALTGCTSEPLGASAGEVTDAGETVAFDRSPTRFGDGLVAVRYPSAQSAELTFVVTDGEQQWEARTNPACTGFTVTRVDGEDLLVILDSDAALHDGVIATETTATAFREDGAVAWGPVSVTGGVSDLGLIAMEMPGGAVTGEPPSGMALSPRTGEALDLPDTERPAYAHHGLLASNSPTGVAVRDAAADGTPLLWHSAPEAPPGASGPARVAADPTASTGEALVLEWPTGDGVQFTVHRFDDGRLLATLPGAPTARTVSTPAGDTAFFTTDAPTGRSVIAVSTTDGELWRDHVPSASQPVSAAPGGVWFTASSGYMRRNVDEPAFVDEPGPAPALVLRSGATLMATAQATEFELVPPP